MTQLDLDHDPTLQEVVSAARLDAIKIDDIALNEEFMRIPTDLAYWNERYVIATRRYLELSYTLEQVKARLWLEIREELQDQGEKFTVDDLKAMVVLRDEYEEVRVAFIDAEARRESARKFAESLFAKRDMLQSLGAKLRVEMLGDPQLRKVLTEAKMVG